MAKDKNYKGMVSEVDPIAIRKLYYEYRMTNQEISNMTWETKANINKMVLCQDLVQVKMRFSSS